MPRALVEPTASSEAEPVRICADCHRTKTVRGVWYLVPGRGPLPFVCETCYAPIVSRRASA